MSACLLAAFRGLGAKAFAELCSLSSSPVPAPFVAPASFQLFSQALSCGADRLKPESPLRRTAAQHPFRGNAVAVRGLLSAPSPVVERVHREHLLSCATRFNARLVTALRAPLVETLQPAAGFRQLPTGLETGFVQ
ncbi:MAG: hypothetical protein QXU62_08220 [Thermofilaceae archaeon]